MLRFEGFPDITWIKLLNLAHHDLCKKLEGFRPPGVSAAEVVKGRRLAHPVLSAEVIAELLKGLTIDLSTSMRSCAGTAWSRLRRIRLNYRLLSDNPQEIVLVYAHELAHILADQVYGGDAGHGAGWKAIARMLGDTGERQHNMDTSALKLKRKSWMWTCGCQDFALGASRNVRASNNMATTGKSGFHCRICKKPLIPKESA